MSSDVRTDIAEIMRTLKRQSNEELIAALRACEGGIPGALDRLLAEMTPTFRPERAKGQQGRVQFDLGGPDGDLVYYLEIGSAKATYGAGPATDPVVTLRLHVVDFLRLTAGRLNGLQAVLSGRLKATGDIGFARTFQSWFAKPFR